MITKAAVRIFDGRQGKEIIIPCHRHSDVFCILKEFGYKPGTDYTMLEQGFLDSHGNFLNRFEARKEAIKEKQLLEEAKEIGELFSEDLLNE